MARPIDQGKLERIKKSAIELVVNAGYGGASIASIAKKAEVADGYLYRFYPSKQQLVEDLLRTRIMVLIDELILQTNQNGSFKHVVKSMFQMFSDMAKEQPMDIKFIYVLMNDYSFQVSNDQRIQIQDLCTQLLNMGHAEGVVGKHIAQEEIYFMLVVYPITFFNMRMKNFFSKSEWETKDLEKMIEFCTNSFSSN